MPDVEGSSALKSLAATGEDLVALTNRRGRARLALFGSITIFMILVGFFIWPVRTDANTVGPTSVQQKAPTITAVYAPGDNITPIAYTVVMSSGKTFLCTLSGKVPQTTYTCLVLPDH